MVGQVKVDLNQKGLGAYALWFSSCVRSFPASLEADCTDSDIESFVFLRFSVVAIFANRLFAVAKGYNVFQDTMIVRIARGGNTRGSWCILRLIILNTRGSDSLICDPPTSLPPL